MQAYILARVSTKEQEDTNSLPSQLRRMQEYSARNDFEIIETFKFAESSTKQDRKQFQQMIKQIEKSKQKIAIITDTVDRMQRDFKESVLLDDLRKRDKIIIHFIRENLILHQNSNSSELMRWDMAVMFAKSYVTQLSDNVKRSFEQKVKNGEWLSKAPYGYRNVRTEDDKSWIEQDSSQALIVLEMYRWYATGSYSMIEIRKKLKKEHNVKMGISLIAKILNNPFYYGEMIIKGKLYPHKYEPIISKDLFEKVEAVIKGFNKKSFKYAGIPFLYRGLIRCAVCGCSVSPERKKGFHYYHCTEFKGKHKTPYVREETISDQVAKAFEAIVLSEDDYKKVSEMLKKAHQDKVGYKSRRVNRLNIELSRYIQRLEKLYEDHLDGVVDDTFYERKASEYRGMRDSIKSKLDAIDKADDAFYLTVDRMLKLTQKAPSLLLRSEMEYSRRLFNFVLQNATLDQSLLRWEYKEPFDILARTAKNANWLARRDSNTFLLAGDEGFEPPIMGPEPTALPLG